MSKSKIVASAESERKALEAARTHYDERYAVARPAALSHRPPLWYVMLIVAIAAALLAAIRTFSVFREISQLGYVANLEAMLAIIGIDLGAPAIGFFIVTEKYRRTGRFGDISLSLNLTVISMIAIQVLASLHAELKGRIGELSADLELAVSIAVAVSAPTLALIAGHTIGQLACRIMHDNKELRADYERRLAEHEKAFQDWYTPRQREYVLKTGGEFVSGEATVPNVPPGESVPFQSVTDGTERRNTSGNRSVPKRSSRNIVLEHLEQNPDDLHLSQRQLAETLGIRLATVNEAVKEYRVRNAQAATNGNGNGHNPLEDTTTDYQETDHD